MNYHIKLVGLFVMAVCCSVVAKGQTEFPKEFILQAKISSGFIAAPSAPELFTGSLQVVPQYTILPYKLRVGLVAGGLYSERKLQGLFGPALSYKLTEFKGGYFGSIGNLYISAEQLWGTGKQRLAGIGINLDLLNKIVVGLSADRDYHLAAWWWQTSIAFRITNVKKPKETFPN